MNKNRLFYVVYLADPFVQSCLDLIRYLAEGAEKTPAHVTVRGPYARRLTEKVEQSINEQIAGIAIDVLGVSSFFENSQNTVYLRCSAPELNQVWDKPDYPFNPHLTLYDGSDRVFAGELLAELHSCSKPFSVTARGVNYLISTQGEQARPMTRLSIELACQHFGIKIDRDASKHNSRDSTMKQIIFVFHALQDYCTEAAGSAKTPIPNHRRSKLHSLCEISADTASSSEAFSGRSRR